jgi:hypothetical protein
VNWGRLLRPLRCPKLLRLSQGFSGTIKARRLYLGEWRFARLIMNALPVDRALAIYGTIASRTELKGTRERLSRHLRKVFLGGEHDPHRLTVHGLTYLQSLDRERGS